MLSLILSFQFFTHLCLLLIRLVAHNIKRIGQIVYYVYINNINCFIATEKKIRRVQSGVTLTDFAIHIKDVSLVEHR